MNNIEIELRYEIINPNQLASFLEPLKFVSKKQVIDIYLDTENADLIKKGVYVRIRDNKKIDIKFNRECLHNPDLELQPYCEEYTFTLPLKENELPQFNTVVSDIGLLPIEHANFDLFKQKNSLIEHRVVDKMRASYVQQQFTIVIDEVLHLGTFLEIELLANDSSKIDETKKEMESLLSGLSLKALKTGYDSLILRKNNFGQYLRGRFILDEDKVFLNKN